MLMAELSTAVAHNLPIKIVLLKNDSLAEVKFEQRELGYPEFGCDLAPIDFVAFARACGADGFRCARVEETRPYNWDSARCYRCSTEISGFSAWGALICGKPFPRGFVTTGSRLLHPRPRLA
jgi:TPP-dependent trihydroxycyclohexane-1,2-dione (THcHDO) dehydratase